MIHHSIMVKSLNESYSICSFPCNVNIYLLKQLLLNIQPCWSVLISRRLLHSRELNCELYNTTDGTMNRMNCTLLCNIIDGPQYNGHFSKKSMISIILSWNEISDVTPFLRKEGRHLDYSTRIYLANFYCGMNSQNWNYARKIAWTHLFSTINFFL